MSQIPVATTKATPNEYLNLWQRCVVNPDSSSQIDAAVKRIKSHEALYQQAVAGTKIPWFCVGIIDEMECGCDQTKHIHNGDPLMKRTVQVPAGRPTSGDGPFTKLESITDWIPPRTPKEVAFHLVCQQPRIWRFDRRRPENP